MRSQKLLLLLLLCFSFASCSTSFFYVSTRNFKRQVIFFFFFCIRRIIQLRCHGVKEKIYFYSLYGNNWGYYYCYYFRKKLSARVGYFLFLPRTNNISFRFNCENSPMKKIDQRWCFVFEQKELICLTAYQTPSGSFNAEILFLFGALK